jgi:two-component system chemotaxis sensor kinase CheA
LECIAHQAENILSQLRSGQRKVTAPVVSLILETIDSVRQILASIESSGSEGIETYPFLVQRLKQAANDVNNDPLAATRWPLKAEREVKADPVVSPQPAAQNAIVQPTPHGITPNPKAVATPATPLDGEKSLSVAETTIRVDVSLLDKLMNLVGELVLARNQILQFNTQKEDSVLNATSQRLNLITTELQESVMKTRMQPIGVVWNKLPRVVRDLTHSLGKQIELVTEGADTELDRTIIEAIKDPLTHLVRNSCDHGIEDPQERVRVGKPANGILTLKAYHEGGQVNIEISDNGAGVDVDRVKIKAVERGLIKPEQASSLSEREALNLLFMPGFSTAKQITNLSGRGVGMDVVKSNIEKIGGAVDLFSRLGEGTTVKLKIPLTLAIIPGLLITSGGQRFVIPQVSLLELIRLEGDFTGKIEYVHDVPVYRRRGSLLPITFLNEVLDLPLTKKDDISNIVVLQADRRRFGLVVDGVSDTQEIVVKPLGKQLKGLPCYAGSTIMGDGEVVLILDVAGVGHLSGVLAEGTDAIRGEAHEQAPEITERQRLLLFRAGHFHRLALPLSLVTRLEEIPRSSVEPANGKCVVQYRDRILPLISLSSILEPGSPEDSGEGPLQVVVVGNEDRFIGLVIDRIIDIVEETVCMRRRVTPRPGLLGSAVIGRNVADLLDLEDIFNATGESFLSKNKEARPMATLLLADASPFNRGLLRNQLEMEGYRVVEASTISEMVERVEREHVNLLVADFDLVSANLSAIDKVRKIPGASNIRTLALVNRLSEIEQHRALHPQFDDYQVRFENEEMLRSVARLASSLGEKDVRSTGTVVEHN